jgi:chromosome segregation ATPase
VCLTAEVYREKYERLQSELDVMTSQFDHIKQKYESAKKTDSRIRKEMGKQLQVGVHRVNALLKDPDKPELGTWKCEKKGKVLSPPQTLKDNCWAKCPSDIAAVQALIDVFRSDIASGKEFFESNVNLRELTNAKMQELAKARKKLAQHKAGNGRKKTELERRKLAWQKDVETAVHKIDVQFRKLMMGKTRPGSAIAGETRQVSIKGELGCAARVALVVPSDFGKAGITIHLSFDGTPFRLLNSGGGCQTFSGGQRSIATIMYLLSLQQHSRRPIRMVDEINQGMGSNNRRLAYSAIGRFSESRNGGCQFFLFSQKLLMNEHRFEYPKSATVLVVHMGQFMIKGKEWNLPKFLRAMKAHARLNAERSEAKKRKALAQGFGRRGSKSSKSGGLF